MEWWWHQYLWHDLWIEPKKKLSRTLEQNRKENLTKTRPNGSQNVISINFFRSLSILSQTTRITQNTIKKLSLAGFTRIFKIHHSSHHATYLIYAALFFSFIFYSIINNETFWRREEEFVVMMMMMKLCIIREIFGSVSKIEQSNSFRISWFDLRCRDVT